MKHSFVRVQVPPPASIKTITYEVFAALCLGALFFFMAGYLRFVGRESWRMTLSVAVPVWIFCYLLFHQVLLVPWPETVVGHMFPALRSIRALNLF